MKTKTKFSLVDDLLYMRLVKILEDCEERHGCHCERCSMLKQCDELNSKLAGRVRDQFLDERTYKEFYGRITQITGQLSMFN